jgi:membrane dipeptidase
VDLIPTRRRGAAVPGALLGLLLAAPAAAGPPVTAYQVDLHLDTPTQLLTRKLPFDAPTGLEAGLHALRAGGTNIAIEVLWPGQKVDPATRVLDLLATLEAEDRRLDAVAIARSPHEARTIAGSGGVAWVLSMEGAHGLGGDWRAQLPALHARGLALLGLTWSQSNAFAGSSGDGGGGLTDEGRALVAEARRLGIVLDVSHASRTATLALCEGSAVPLVASHSDAHAVHAHARNLTDEEVRCIAATGGVIGLNFHAPFVGARADVAAVADHAEHLARVGGHGVVALGSDYDGYIRTPVGLEDASRLPALWEELRRRGWTEDQLSGLRGGNFLRAWQGALDAAQAAPRSGG